MKMTECELMIVPRMDIFNGSYELKDENILLDSIDVCSANKGLINKVINFEIKHIDSKVIIYPLEISKEYVIRYERVVRAKKIEINKEDYFKKSSDNGNYTFYIN